MGGDIVADTVATTCIDGAIWSSRATELFLSLLLHISQYNSVFKPLSDYESAALTIELQGHKAREESFVRRGIVACGCDDDKRAVQCCIFGYLTWNQTQLQHRLGHQFSRSSHHRKVLQQTYL